MANFEIVETKGDIIPDTKDFGATVYCTDGFKVTGGGFWSANLNITISGPFDLNLKVINNGWRVEGRPAETGDPLLQIYAICVEVKQGL
jgi:hypothetical protein